MSGYASAIRAVAPNYDPRHLEAWMRVEHPTLDGLSQAQFRAEVEFARVCADATCTADSEALARSLGL